MWDPKRLDPAYRAMTPPVEVPAQKPVALACPVCGGAMVSREQRIRNGLRLEGPHTRQRFWGCRRFPACRGTRNTDGM